jgi:D-alanine-D-alanine ligase
MAEGNKMQIILIKSITNKPWRSPETYQLIEESLREIWPVETINTNNPQNLYLYLEALKRGYAGDFFIFNIAEYLDENKKETFLPYLLDLWEMPHLGSNSVVISNGLNKVKTKEILIKNNIPTPKYIIAENVNSETESQAENIGYPLFVKPMSEGGHIGISKDSIVNNFKNLLSKTNQIITELGQPALIEEYITGDEMREFSVGIIDGETRIFTPVEIDYKSMNLDIPILSYDAATNDLERIKRVEETNIREKIVDLAQRTFNAIGACDYSRVDIRMNHTGYYVLEINIMPGLGPHSFLPEAAKSIHGLSYKQLIQKLTKESILRILVGNIWSIV